MDFQAVSIPTSIADSKSRARVLAQIGELWDSQLHRRESISPAEGLRLAEARRAFRVGNISRVKELLQELKSPEAYNLRGLLHEALGEHEEARRFYQRALAADRSLYAAELNLRRSFELWEFGESQIPFAL